MMGVDGGRITAGFLRGAGRWVVVVVVVAGVVVEVEVEFVAEVVVVVVVGAGAGGRLWDNSNWRRAEEFQRFLIALSVRAYPASRIAFAIKAHLVPC